MKIMLVFPPLTVSERYANKNVGDVGGYLPPLGLLYMAAVLETVHEISLLQMMSLKKLANSGQIGLVWLL